MEVSEQVKQIKRSFRLYMNGVTASSMRRKGLDYKVNWGVSQLDLRRMAAMYGKDKQLAEALWAETSIRECRMLATLVMPAEDMTVGHAVEWMGDDVSVELMEMVMFNLFRNIAHADVLAERLLGMQDPVARMGGYNLVGLVLKRGATLGDTLYSCLFAAASDDLHVKDNRQLLHALLNCLQYVASLGIPQATIAESMLASLE